MRFNAPTISNLRLSRIHRWALLWLTWFAAFLDEAAAFAPLTKQARAIAHQWLDKIELAIVGVAALQAARRTRRAPPRKRLFSARPNQRASRRAILGSRLRRALRPKDLHARIAALRQDINGLVAYFLKRLPCGLTRRAIITRPEAQRFARAAAIGAPALAPNTS